MPFLQLASKCDLTIIWDSSVDSHTIILFNICDHVVASWGQCGKTFSLEAKGKRHFLHLYIVDRVITEKNVTKQLKNGAILIMQFFHVKITAQELHSKTFLLKAFIEKIVYFCVLNKCKKKLTSFLRIRFRGLLKRSLRKRTFATWK